MPSSPRRILIVRLSHLGDVVHALGVFHALRAQHPAAEIGWAVQREFAGFLHGMPGLERVFELDRRGGLRAWRALRRELVRWGPDWTIDAQGNVKSAVASRLSGAPRRSGLAASDWRERAGSWLVPDRAPRASGPHAMERMQALADHVAPANGSRRTLCSDPALTEAELAAARCELERRCGTDLPGVLVHLTTPGDVRSWPRERFRELGQALSASRTKALFLSGPSEADFGRELGRELSSELPGAPHLTHWIGQRGLRELAAVMTILARSGAVFTGCDSGPMHLAWAAGLPVVCLSGPQDARRTGPWPLHGPHRVVRASAAPACAPCLARACAHPDGPVCMARITAADVVVALASVRAHARSGAPLPSATAAALRG